MSLFKAEGTKIRETRAQLFTVSWSRYSSAQRPIRLSIENLKSSWNTGKAEPLGANPDEGNYVCIMARLPSGKTVIISKNQLVLPSNKDFFIAACRTRPEKTANRHASTKTAQTFCSAPPPFFLSLNLELMSVPYTRMDMGSLGPPLLFFPMRTLVKPPFSVSFILFLIGVSGCIAELKTTGAQVFAWNSSYCRSHFKWWDWYFHYDSKKHSFHLKENKSLFQSQIWLTKDRKHTFR